MSPRRRDSASCVSVLLLLGLLGGCALERSGLFANEAPPASDLGADAPVALPDLGEEARDLGSPPPSDMAAPPMDMPLPAEDMAAPSVDLGFDAGFDGGFDAGLDAGLDGGRDAGVDAGPPDLGCTGPDACIGGVHTYCIGGVSVTELCALGCSTTTPTRCALFRPSNVDAALFTADGDVLLPASIDTTACSVPGATIAPQGGGLELCVVRGRDVTVPAGATVRVTGSRGLVLLAARDVLVDGVLDASARGTSAGPGAVVGGSGAGGNGAHRDAFGDGGGGGGGRCGGGGAGGRGSGDASSPAEAAGGAAGAVVSVGTLSRWWAGARRAAAPTPSACRRHSPRGAVAAPCS